MELHEALYTTRAMRRVNKDPIPLDVQARILDAAVHAPSGGNQQNWRFLLLDDPGQEGGPRPAVPARHGRAVEDDLQGADRRGARQPRCPRVRSRSSRCSAPPNGWPTISRTCPSSCSPSAQHDPTGGSIYPAVWSAMLAARAEGVGSCLTALLAVLPSERDVRDPRRALRPRLDPLGDRELRLSDRHLGRGNASALPTRSRTATPGAPTSASRFPIPCGRADRSPTDVAAPFAGTVLRVEVAPGDTVAAGSRSWSCSSP